MTEDESIVKLMNFFKERFWVIFWVTMEGEKSSGEIREIWGRSESSLYQKYKGKDPISEMSKKGVIKENKFPIDRRYRPFKSYPVIFSMKFRNLFDKNEVLLRQTVFKLSNLKVLVNGDMELLLKYWKQVMLIIHLIVVEEAEFIPKIDIRGYFNKLKVERRNNLKKKGFSEEQINQLEEDTDHLSEKMLKTIEENESFKQDKFFSTYFPSFNVVGYINQLREDGFFEKINS